MILDDRAPFWTLAASGNVDTDNPGIEDFLKTLRSEAREEICTDKITDPDYVGSSWALFPPPKQDGDKDGYNHERVYVSSLQPGAPDPVLGEDGAGLAWVPLDNLPANVVPRVRTRIEAYLSGPASGGAPFNLKMDSLGEGRKGFSPMLFKMNREQIFGWDMWINHPRVQQKLLNHKCFEPFNEAINEVTNWANPALAAQAAQCQMRA